MTTNEIPVAEQFYSIQGEGPYAGTPAVFLRLAGCNLCCGGWHNKDKRKERMGPGEDATWVCDTIDVWREADKTYGPSELLEDWEARGWVDALTDGAHIVLTGGEPTLPARQKAFIGFVAEWLKADHAKPYVEVETNGTVEPQPVFTRYVNHYNVSLKLSNSGMTENERLNPDAIREYTSLASDGDAVFKFVVSREEDVAEIDDLVDEYGIPESAIMLMPAGATQDDLAMTYPDVAALCKERGWQFSPRLHVTIWDKMTGV